MFQSASLTTLLRFFLCRFVVLCHVVVLCRFVNMYKRASLAAVAIFFVSLRRFGVVSSICTKSASLATVVFLCVCRFVAMHKGPALNCFDFVVCVFYRGRRLLAGIFFLSRWLLSTSFCGCLCSKAQTYDLLRIMLCRSPTRNCCDLPCVVSSLCARSSSMTVANFFLCLFIRRAGQPASGSAPGSHGTPSSHDP